MFIPYNANPNEIRTGDCTVRAIMIATGYTWNRTYLELCTMGYMMGEMPSSNTVWRSYLRARGFRPTLLPDECPDCYTVRDFCEDHPYGIYVLCTGERDGTHVLTVINGNYFDAWDSGNEILLMYWRR